VQLQRVVGGQRHVQTLQEEEEEEEEEEGEIKAH